MFVKNLLNFLVLLMLNLHIARGGFLDIITTTPTKIMYGVLTGNYGKMLHTYVETVEKPVTYMVATTGVLVGTLKPRTKLVMDVEEFRKHPHAAFFACGPDNNQFAKHLAEFAVVVTEGCLPKIDAMHACCLEHDACYTRLGVSQDECDKPFCNCMKVATNGTGCAAMGDSFCFLVIDYGEDSYKEAQEVSFFACLLSTVYRGPYTPNKSWKSLLVSRFIVLRNEIADGILRAQKRLKELTFLKSKMYRHRKKRAEMMPKTGPDPGILPRWNKLQHALT